MTVDLTRFVGIEDVACLVLPDRHAIAVTVDTEITLLILTLGNSLLLLVEHFACRIPHRLNRHARTREVIDTLGLEDCLTLTL